MESFVWPRIGCVICEAEQCLVLICAVVKRAHSIRRTCVYGSGSSGVVMFLCPSLNIQLLRRKEQSSYEKYLLVVDCTFPLTLGPDGLFLPF